MEFDLLTQEVRDGHQPVHCSACICGRSGVSAHRCFAAHREGVPGRREAGSRTPTIPAHPTAASFLWAPKLGRQGIQRIHMLRDVIPGWCGGRRRFALCTRTRCTGRHLMVDDDRQAGAHHRLAGAAGLRPGGADAWRGAYCCHDAIGRRSYERGGRGDGRGGDAFGMAEIGVAGMAARSPASRPVTRSSGARARAAGGVWRSGNV